MLNQRIKHGFAPVLFESALSICPESCYYMANTIYEKPRKNRTGFEGSNFSSKTDAKKRINPCKSKVYPLSC